MTYGAAPQSFRNANEFYSWSQKLWRIQAKKVQFITEIQLLSPLQNPSYTKQSSGQVQTNSISQRVRGAFVPDFTLKWSGWTAFRAVFDTSLAASIPDLPEDSTHWWGPDTNFFASRLGKNAFTVVGGIHSNPDDPNAVYKGVSWDQEANVKLLREKYAVSQSPFSKGVILYKIALLIPAAGLEPCCKISRGHHTIN